MDNGNVVSGEVIVANKKKPCNAKKKKPQNGLAEKRWSVGRVIMFVVLVLYSATLVGALLWAFLTSLKGNIEYIRDPLSLPKDWKFSNYIDVIYEMGKDGTSFPVMFLNSIWLSVLPPTINILTGAMAAYVMAQYKFPGRDLIWGIMVVTMALPILGTGAAVYKMYMTLGFYDSPLILLTNVAGLGGGLFFIAAFKGISKTYMEAAMLEGAGHFQTFLTIMLPQIKGTMLALWTMSFMGSWNDYMTPIMYLPSYTPIPTGLYKYQLRTERFLNVPLLFAGSMIVLIPPLTLFAVFQNKFMEISFGGGIKS